MEQVTNPEIVRVLQGAIEQVTEKLSKAS